MERSQQIESGVTAPPDKAWKRAAAGVVVVMVALLVRPVFGSPPNDGFPLSTFPMFSTLIDPVVSIDVVVGIDAEGRVRTLDPETIAGTDEIIVAGSIVSQAVRAGSTATDALCIEAARRIPDPETIVSVEVRTDVIDAIAWFDGDKTALSSVTHATCGTAR